MHTRSTPLRITLAFLLLLGLSVQVVAQGDMPQMMYAVTVYQCDYTALPGIIENANTKGRPVAQSLVDEGKLMAWGRAIHHWGDEWNLLTWSAAPSMQALLDARDEGMRRYQEANPADAEDMSFIEACPIHRDYFYTLESATMPGDAFQAATPDETNALAVSFYQCPYPALDEIIAWERETMYPAAQTLVNEGGIGGRSVFTHAWGDEWNLVVTHAAKELPALFEGLSTLSERTGTRPMVDDPTPITSNCTAHKDNIYTVVTQTTPPSE